MNYRYLHTLIFIVGLCGASFFAVFPLKALAAEQTWIAEGASGSNFPASPTADIWIGQKFVATTTLSKLIFNGSGTGAGDTTFQIYFCKGVLTSTNADRNCSGAGQSVVYATTTVITTSGWPTFSSETVVLPNINFCGLSGLPAYGWFSLKATDRAFTYNGNNTNPYAGGVSLNQTTGANHDLLFYLYYEDTENSFCYEPDVEIYESEMDAYICGFQPCINFSEYQYCYLDKLPCTFEITYNSLAAGSQADLLFYGDYWPEDAIATTTLPLNRTVDNSLIIPVDTTASTSEYSIYLESDNGDILKSKKMVEWVYSYEIDDIWDDFQYEDCTCDDIATSSGTTWDDFRWGMECGLHKTFCWLVYPSEYGHTTLQKANDIAVRQFPISIGYDIYNVLSSTTEASIDLSLKPPSALGFNPSVTLISSTTLSTGLGTTLYGYWHDAWNYLFYLGALSYVSWYLLFRRLGSRPPDENYDN